MTGPLYERHMTPLPRTAKPHMVPSGYWKVVAVAEGETLRVAAFIMDQTTPRNTLFCSHQVTVDVVERRSGYRLFYDYPGTVQPLAAELGC